MDLDTLKTLTKDLEPLYFHEYSCQCCAFISTKENQESADSNAMYIVNGLAACSHEYARFFVHARNNWDEIMRLAELGKASEEEKEHRRKLTRAILENSNKPTMSKPRKPVKNEGTNDGF